ncbi:MAG: Crp/Fnr family transcriptional regulator [Bacteroidales bacterium]|nr:Crp/Fnr family transcriptional regulator [Bacteroidales bacterium]MDZ4203796.1 Crp/Fnr family transcriptional regulator [Bacteroidales bacterium]
MLIDVKCQDCPVHKGSYFKFLDPCDLADLFHKKTCYFYKKGQVIFYEGKRPLGIYCVQSGKIKISRLGVEGKEQIVRIAMPGDLLGLRSLIAGRNYSNSATTIDDSVVCFINKRKFFQITIRYPEISTRIMLTLSTLLEEAEKKITSMAQKPVRERLAEALLTLDEVFHSDGCPTVISLTREDLANMVGTANETVIRLLSEFKEEKMVAVKGRKILILDKKGLHRVAKV